MTVDSKNATTVGQFTLSLTDSLWQATVGDAITASPAVAPDGTLYFGGNDRSFYALAPDGSQKWSFVTGGFIDTCSPTVAPDGTIYTGSNDGKLYAFAPDGTSRWTHDFTATAPLSNSPSLAADGTIYVKANDGFLYALNPADGSTKWRRDVGALQSYGSASIAPDGTIYQGSENKNLYAINPADGSLKWTFAADNDIYTVPALDAAGNIYFTVLNTGKLFSVSSAGALRWTYSGASLGSSSSPVLSADGATVYFGGYDKKLHAVNTANGTVRWVFTLADEIRASSPAIDASGVIYIGCYDFKLYAINPDGTLKRTYDTGNWIRSSPLIFGNTLYVGSNDHKLYAFDLGTGAASGPWPQYRNNPRRTGRVLNEPLAITTAPASQVAVLGLALALNVTATGNGPLAYQWFKDGAALSGATGPAFTVATVTAATAGRYSVTVSGPQGAVTSSPAAVTVESPAPGRLVNLSVRTAAGTGAQTLTVGFVVGLGPAKPLLLRGIGPSLTPFGVAGALADPQLQLFSSASPTALATNDNWGGGAALATAFSSVGAFALAPASLDAALQASLTTGNYTVQITGPSGATGIALAELYDLDPTPTGAQTVAPVSRLFNVSARAQVGTGAGLLIAGFTISGNLPKTVLLRAIGPALGAFGVTGVLANPKLELYRGAAKINENDDWSGNAALVAAFAQVGAFALPNTASRDAALLVTLAPGSYTAQVTGVANTTGVALVEVYEVP